MPLIIKAQQQTRTTREERTMTRKEMITICVDDQIKRGIVKPENRTMQINARLNGRGPFKAMSKAECIRWYEEVTK